MKIEKSKKRAISFCVTFLMILSVFTAIPGAKLTVSASIASGKCGDNLTWTLDGDGLLTIAGTGDMWDWEREATPWAEYRESIKTIIISNGAEDIGNLAFWGCTNLESVTIPNTVTYIGKQSFRGCNKMTSLVIPDSVTTIGDWAFSMCDGLSSVTISKNLTSIGEAAFSWWYNMTNIDIDPSNPNFKSVNGVLFNKSGTELIVCPAGRTGDYEIPANVTRVGNYAFFGCNDLTSIEIPNSLTSIGTYAFWDCVSLTSVIIPASVTTIEDCAFYGCSRLTEIKADVANPNYTSLDGVLFNKSKSKLVQYPMGKVGVKYIIPNGVTTIGAGALSNCRSLTSVTIPNSVTTIGSSAFWGCNNLPSVTIPANVTTIGDWAFYSCNNLAKVYFEAVAPPTVGTNAFSTIFNDACAIVPATWANEYIVEGSLWHGLKIEYTKIYGDLNGDGKINIADLICLSQHLTGTKLLTGNGFESAKVNGDNGVTMADLVRLAQWIAEIDLTPLGSK